MNICGLPGFKHIGALRIELNARMVSGCLLQQVVAGFEYLIDGCRYKFLEAPHSVGFLPENC